MDQWYVLLILWIFFSLSNTECYLEEKCRLPNKSEFLISWTIIVSIAIICQFCITEKNIFWLFLIQFSQFRRLGPTFYTCPTFLGGLEVDWVTSSGIFIKLNTSYPIFSQSQFSIIFACLKKAYPGSAWSDFHHL